MKLPEEKINNSKRKYPFLIVAIQIFLAACIIYTTVLSKGESSNPIPDPAPLDPGYDNPGAEVSAITTTPTMTPMTPESICTSESRAAYMEKVCQGHHGEVRVDERSWIRAITVNREKRVLLCRLNKAGTMASLSYFSHINTNITSSKHRVLVPSYDFDKLPKNEPRNIYYRIKFIPLKTVLSRFKNFTKIVIGRHPLQRFISAYYEIVVSNKHRVGRLINTLEEFVTVLLQDKTITDPHWMDYQQSCHPCVMKYDHVFKLERLSVDSKHLNLLVGAHPDASFAQTHSNERLSGNSTVDKKTKETLSPSSFKYDDILKTMQSEHPQLFKYVLETYKLDMEMFGYSWQRNTSVCLQDGDKCC